MASRAGLLLHTKRSKGTSVRRQGSDAPVLIIARVAIGVATQVVRTRRRDDCDGFTQLLGYRAIIRKLLCTRTIAPYPEFMCICRVGEQSVGDAINSISAGNEATREEEVVHTCGQDEIA